MRHSDTCRQHSICLCDIFLCDFLSHLKCNIYYRNAQLESCVCSTRVFSLQVLHVGASYSGGRSKASIQAFLSGAFASPAEGSVGNSGTPLSVPASPNLDVNACDTLTFGRVTLVNKKRLRPEVKLALDLSYYRCPAFNSQSTPLLTGQFSTVPQLEPYIVYYLKHQGPNLSLWRAHHRRTSFMKCTFHAACQRDQSSLGCFSLFRFSAPIPTDKMSQFKPNGSPIKIKRVREIER